MSEIVSGRDRRLHEARSHRSMPFRSKCHERTWLKTGLSEKLWRRLPGDVTVSVYLLHGVSVVLEGLERRKRCHAHGDWLIGMILSQTLTVELGELPEDILDSDIHRVLLFSVLTV